MRLGLECPRFKRHLGFASDAAGNELLPFWAAALVWTGYTSVVVAAAAWLTSRRDV